MSLADPVLSIEQLSVDYRALKPTHAVVDVDLQLGRGEVLGLAGESGCGKSTLAYAVSRLSRPPAAVVGGKVTFHEKNGTDIDMLGISGDALRRRRWKKMAMVFQGAMNALNPVMKIGAQLDDVFTTHEPQMSSKDRKERCIELLNLVGVDPRRYDSYPHELSGGMRQRVMIAMALALNPDIVIMDEPTTALDVVVQRDILAEITRLREIFGFAVIFITHDLSLLLEISDRIAIMYSGRIVEQGRADVLLEAPLHPYTVGLLRSFPSLTGAREDHMRGIPGHPPNLAEPIAGCAFSDRCPFAREVCGRVRPELIHHGEYEASACHARDPQRYGAPTPAELIAGQFPVADDEVVTA